MSQDEWNVDTLKAFIEARLATLDEKMAGHWRLDQERFTAAEKAVNASLTAAKDAVGKAEEATAKRFDSVNAFRAQLTDQAATFMPRSESEQRHRQVSEKIEKMDKNAQECMSRAEYNARHDDLVHQVAQLTSRVDRGSGQELAESANLLTTIQNQRNRQNLMMGWVVGITVALIALVSLLVAIFR